MQTVILLMAGRGTRTGLKENKMMYKINNKPMYQYVLDTFKSFNMPIILVVGKSDYDYVRHNVSENITVVLGGETRNESVLNALEHVKTDRVMIHDAARVLVSKDIIQACINNNADAYYVAVPLKDTIRDKKSQKTLDRSLYYSVQTPQGGKTDLFKQYEKYSTTDDISSFDNTNVKIDVIIGSDYNFKVTTEFDIKMVENLLKED
ncbi:MAG: 2-C-methyl-D-erythritol 4-phosphate cytidylyltransferase [Acholeplasmatales bacterium]|nr:2-C-methyl-D-erythritol 4-phosphate cytidylyltransferase [Acholeplasmatales bacterium]